jgi:type I restriction enzyme, S subunit
MKILTVKSKWFNESDLRLDAEFHLSDGPRTNRSIKSSGVAYKSLKNVTREIFKGQIFKRCYVSSPEHGIPFLTASDMVKADIDSGLFLSKKYTGKKESLLIKEDCILVSRSGTLGQTILTNKPFAGVIGSDDLIRIIPDPSKLSSGYLYAFLATKHGHSLLTQASYGGVIKHIEPHHIEQLPIPLLDKIKIDLIDKKIKQSSELRFHANKSLKEATSYFDSMFSDVNHFERIFVKNTQDFNFSWVGRNNDVIAERWINKIKSRQHLVIKNVADKAFSPPMFKHIYLKKDNGYPFFTGAELAKSFRLKYRFLSEKGVKDIKDYTVKENTLLIYKSGPRNGMVGDVFLLDKALNNACLSDHVIRVMITDKYINSWCFAFLKSKVGKRILHNMATGTAVLFITPERIQNLVIPQPDKNLDFIASKIDDYINSFNEAHLLVEEAVNIIEKEIESWQK